MRLSLWSACLLSASAAASDAKLALDGLDPVELIQGQTAQGQPRYSAERGDFRYWFKSEENRSKFASDPEKYGLQLNGKCVLSDSMPGTQKLHTVVDGRIYLGASEHCIGRFKESPGTFVDVNTGKRLAMRTDSPAQDDRQKVAILIFEGVQIIDYTGPYEVFGQAGFNVYTVAEKPGTLTTSMGMKVTPNYTFDNAPVPRRSGDAGWECRHRKRHCRRMGEDRRAEIQAGDVGVQWRLLAGEGGPPGRAIRHDLLRCH